MRWNEAMTYTLFVPRVRQLLRRRLYGIYLLIYFLDHITFLNLLQLGLTKLSVHPEKELNAMGREINILFRKSSKLLSPRKPA